MSDIHWIPIDIQAFVADTMDFDEAATGAYWLLILHYYQQQKGCVANDRILATVTKSANRWKKYKSLVLSRFEIRNGRLWHPRCEEEIAKAKQLISEKSEHAKKAAAGRWGNARGDARAMPEHNPSNARAMPEHMPEDSPSNAPGMHTYNNKERKKEERPPNGGLKKKENPPDGGARDPPPRILDHPIPPDFSLSSEDLSRCMNDGADPPWVWNVFNNWKAGVTEAGVLHSDWKAAWWRRWEKSKPPSEPARPKPRLVVSGGSAAARKTVLPDDWQPNANNAAICAEEGYDLDAMAQHFRDVCGANGYRYINHHLAFSNFIRNQKNFTRGNGYGKAATTRGSIIDAADRAIANIDRQIAEIRAAEGNVAGGETPVPKLPED
jgi:uncharacterized protein YdaU (DUF1376 family)